MSFGVGVGDLIAVSNLTSKIRKQFVDSPDQFQDICQEVKSLSNILRDVEELLPERDLTDGQKTDLQHVTEGCSSVLTALEKVLEKYRDLDTNPKSIRDKSRRVWKRLKWEPDDIRDLRLRIVSSIGLLNAFNGTIASQFSSETKQGVDELRTHNHDVENQAIIDWLTPIDYTTQQSDFIGRRQKGTGQWLLDSEKFQWWQNNSKQTLFCPGIPGAGKTMITSIVVDHLCDTFQNEADIGIAYLYCNYRRKEEQNPEYLLLSLIKQLVQELPSVPEKVKSLYEHHKYKRTRPSFDEISTVLQSVVVNYSRVFIIIDALDECHDSDGYRRKVLSEIFSLQNKSEANLFATSRFIPEITKQFEGSIFLEILASDEDVERYLDGKMPQLRPFISRNLALQEEIKTKIINAVDGMFLLAQLHMDSLRDKTTPKLVRLALKNLPKGSEALNSAYNEAVERIEAQDKGLQELARRTLSWVTLANRPLNALELQHALAVEIEEPRLDQENLTEVEELISVCAGLVTFDEESDIIRLAHYTTQEYFERTWISWIPNAEVDIMRTCLTYLSFDTFGVDFCKSCDDIEARLESNPLYDYAARNWGYHASTASIEVEEVILRFLEREANVISSSQVLILSPQWSSIQPMPVYATGMHLVTYFGLTKVMVTLIKNGCNPDMGDSDDRTPLSWAAAIGNEAAVKLLLVTDGVNPNSKDYTGRTPLSFAAKYGLEAVVKLLLAHDDIDPEPKSSEGETPLFNAARNGHDVVVELLLAYESVDPDSKDVKERTPLLEAARYGHEKVVRILLAREDVDVNCKDWLGRTPLLRAAEFGHEAVVRSLLERKGIDVNAKDLYCMTPLLRAVEFEHETVVRILLKREDFGSCLQHDRFGRTPLSLSAEYGYEGIVCLILSREDIDVNSRDEEGRTPLCLAAWNGHDEVVRLLLEREDVDIDSMDMDHQTPLLRAAKYGQEIVVRLLLERRNADSDSKDASNPYSAYEREMVMKTLESAKRDFDNTDHRPEHQFELFLGAKKRENL